MSAVGLSRVEQAEIAATLVCPRPSVHSSRVRSDSCSREQQATIARLDAFARVERRRVSCFRKRNASE
jgi:hypothetical protein